MLDRKTLLKNFTIGFLPLLIFIIADELFGLTVGLIVAIVFGITEVIFTYIREHRLDRFILLDTGLILTLGMISLIFHNDIFFKIKPALIESILVILLGITAFSSNPILIRMTGRYMKGLEFSDDQVKMMRRMMQRMFYIFIIHTILIFYSAFYMSTEAWGFISGGLFYILMGIMALNEFIRAKLQQRRLNAQYADEEWFDILDTEGNIRGRAPRSVVHGNPDMLHAVVHVQILNSKGQLLLQKRADNKDVQPGKWDTAIGGHIHSGETVEHALHRESEEELGISMGKFKPLFRYVMRNNIESELVHSFLLEEEGPFFPDKAEISEIRFWSIDEIEQNLQTERFTPNFEQEFVLLMKLLFKRDIQLKGQ